MNEKNGTWLDGQLLIAMPSMRDQRFERTVIYVCSHSSEGAMGLVINKTQDVNFRDLLVQLSIIEKGDADYSFHEKNPIIVRDGGPVERSRGFVLHSDEYEVESSLVVKKDDSDTGLCLTATIDILKAISKGKGPKKAIMALGYSGWSAGQLEAEISDNGWLICPGLPDVIFEDDMERIYDRALGQLGIDAVNLSRFTGHA